MDFSNRNSQQPNHGSHNPQNTAVASQQTSNVRKDGRKNTDQNKITKILGVVLGATVSVLVIALLAFIAISGQQNSNNNNEYGQVKTNYLQAVFLNTGQVYFGNIKKINSNFFELTNIFYLQTSGSSTSTQTTSSSSSVSLVKLGCELHAPMDEMIINSQQVTFWENLKSNGKVASAIAKFNKQNPNGQSCNTTPTASANSGNNVSTSTPTTSTTVKTPVK